jgi:hypothetical protein
MEEEDEEVTKVDGPRGRRCCSIIFTAGIRATRQMSAPSPYQKTRNGKAGFGFSEVSELHFGGR